MSINDEFIQQIIDGNKDQYKTIIKTYYKPIYRYMCKFVQNTEDAKDITQEVFIRVYENLRKYNAKKSSFKTWLYKVATNYSYDYTHSKSYRALARSVELQDDVIEFNDNDPLEALIQTEQVSYVIDIINNNLSNKHKQILYLYYFAELEVNEISIQLDIPNKTVYSAIQSSLKKIRKEMTQ